MRKSIVFLVVIGGGLGFAVGVKVARSQPENAARKPAQRSAPAFVAPAASSSSAMLVVPRAATPINVDGEPEDPAWTAKELLRTPAYSERPYSDARFTVRDGNLYVLLYAADEDLHATGTHDRSLWGADAMRVVLTPQGPGREYVVEVSPAGTLTDYTRAGNGAPDFSWESGAKVGVDLDGTLDQSSDMDEEWVAELSIPLASLGSLEPAHTLGLRVERTDVSKGSASGSALMSWSPPGGRVTLAE